MSITSPTICRAEIARAQDRVYGAGWAYSIILTTSGAEPGAMSQPDFEALIRAATHSHIVCVFEY